MKCLGASFFVKWCAKHRSCLSNEANIFFVAQNYNYNRGERNKTQKITHLVSYRGENQKNGLNVQISPWKNKKKYFFHKNFQKFSISFTFIYRHGVLWKILWKFDQKQLSTAQINKKLRLPRNFISVYCKYFIFSNLLCSSI